MAYFNLHYEMTVILIVNILRTGLLKKVMDSFSAVEDKNRKILKAVYGLYYLMTALCYWRFRVSAAYALCSTAALLGLACFYQAAWKKKLWISLSFSCMDMGSLLLVYFAFSGRISGPENAVWILLLLLCVSAIGRVPGTPEEKDASCSIGQMLLLSSVPALCIFAFGCIRYGCLGDLPAAFLCAALLAINLCVFHLYHILQKNYVQLRERDIYRQQTLAYQNQLEVILESQNRIRALKHDMKNHILTLQALAKDTQSEAFGEYLSSMQEFMVNPSEHVFTGNEALDSLLNYKLQRAKECLKSVETDIVLPERIKLHSFDLNIILGNLLDNAIAAAEQTGERLLKLSLRMEKGMLFLRMVNSCRNIPDGVCDMRKLADNSPEGHGIGLLNVMRIVEKYCGEMDMRCNADRMETAVMLYIRKL